MSPGRKSRYAESTRDANEPALVRVAQQLGAGVWLAPPLDGWIVQRGLWRPMEIKMPEREGLAGEYTAAQLRFLTFCNTHQAPVVIWRTELDVIKSLGGKVTA